MTIYKYLRLDDNVIESLCESFFRFTQVYLLNDKFEGNYGTDLNHENTNKVKLAIAQNPTHPIELLYKLTSTFPRIQFNPYNNRGNSSGTIKDKEENKKIYKDALKMQYENIVRNTCVFSLTSKLNSELMWSHYADQERGVIIGFNSENAIFSELKKVKYTKVRPNYNEIEKKYFSVDGINCKELEVYITNALFTKSNCWRNESEYRLIKKTSESDKRVNENVLLYKIPLVAWESIYFGQFINSKYESILINKRKTEKDWQHISVYNVFQSTGTYEYEVFERKFG